MESITNADGKPARKITVQGMSPDVLLIKSMDNQRVTFVNGEATITVPDSYFIPKEITTTETDFPSHWIWSFWITAATRCRCHVIRLPLRFPRRRLRDESAYRYLRNQRSQLDAVLSSVRQTVPSTSTANSVPEDISSGQFSVSLPLSMGENTFDLKRAAPYSAANKHHLVINRAAGRRCFLYTELLAHEPLTLGQSWMGI